MCSSKNPSWADDRTTTEIGIVNYESSLPWELTTGSRASTSDTIGLFTQGHKDFSSEICNAHKHISMQQPKPYVGADINIFDSRLDYLFLHKMLLSLWISLKREMQVFTWLWFSAHLEGSFICRTGYLCCMDFLPFLPCVPWVYRHNFVKRLQVFQVNTSLRKKHETCALDAQPRVNLL